MTISRSLRKIIVEVALLLLAVHSSFEQQGSYTIVAPKVLRPSSYFHVSVSVHNTQRPVDVTVYVGGRSFANKPYTMSNQANVASGETKILQFQIGDWGQGQYNVSVTGTGGLQFHNSTELTYEHKSYSVFIQTDKAVYKPGQKVRFRVIAVNPMLRPNNVDALEIFMADGKMNRVKQWKRVFPTKGVFSGELDLSDQPVLGTWNITVAINDQYYSKTFQVAEFILPTFEVTVDLPAYALFDKSDIVATVRAKYTYGKPVKGSVTILVAPLIHSSQIQVYYTEPLRKTAQIDGQVSIPINIQKELHLEDDYQRLIQVEAIVKEDLTGRRQNGTAYIPLYKHKVSLEFIKTAETFKPGLKYTAYLKVANQDDTPVQDQLTPVVIKHAYNHDPAAQKTMSVPIPRNGTIQLDFFPPNSHDATVLLVTGNYDGVDYQFPPVYRAESPSGTYLQAVLLSQVAKVGSEIELVVNSTEPMSSFSCVVMGRGDIALAQTVSLDRQTSHKFKFQATAPMAPKARVVVYFVRSDGEVVADALDFPVEGALQTPITVASDQSETKPGGTVKLRVNTRANAFVGLLGVDQSMLLYKSGNDITPKDVLQELDTYDSGKKTTRDEDLFQLIWSPGSNTAAQVFQDSGVVILTNGLVFENTPFKDVSIIRFKPRRVPGLQSEAEERLHKNELLAIMKKPKEEPTWLWVNQNARPDGSLELEYRAPDTITSWVISAFAVDSLYGLGVAQDTKKVTVFRPFFVSLNLPYSIVRGEAVAIQVIVFNYLKNEIDAEVTLKNSGEFDFVNSEEDMNSVENRQSQKGKRIKVRPGDGTQVTFMIVPRKLGYLDIQVSAVSPVAADGVLKKLLVKAEGAPQYINKALLIDLRRERTFNTALDLEFPQYYVQDSEDIQVAVIGDVMGPTILGLDKLLRMPYGCGEQNMLNFVPNIVITEYLNQTKRLTDNVRGKAVMHMETGYQRELTYKRSDGSFSAFGDADKSGSTWLTAFVAKSFQQAKAHITIDNKVINDAFSWLVNNQAQDGSFPEVGSVSHKEMQGGSSKGLALTAYVLTALLENRDEAKTRFQPAVTRAIQRLEEDVVTLDDVYALSIVTYALHLANSGQRELAFSRLEQRSKTVGDYKYWKKVVDAESPSSFNRTRSIDVEATGYALMTMVIRNNIEASLPIMRWLISMRNDNGGFLSTQDTVIAIQALAKLAQSIVVGNPAMEISVSTNASPKSATMSVSSQNSMIMQMQKLPNNVRRVEISARGSGFAIAQVSYVYNLHVTKELPAFSLNPQVDKTSDENHLQVNICASYMERGTSNMAVMDVTLPSGFTVDKESLNSLSAVQDVKRWETKEGDSGVVIYFDKIGRDQVCPTIKSYRTFRVARQKPVAVQLYDYYDLTKTSRTFYEALPATLCDICEHDDCSNFKCAPRIRDNEISDRSTDGVGGQVGSCSTVRISGLILVAIFLAQILLNR